MIQTLTFMVELDSHKRFALARQMSDKLDAALADCRRAWATEFHDVVECQICGKTGHKHATTRRQGPHRFAASTEHITYTEKVDNATIAAVNKKRPVTVAFIAHLLQNGTAK